MKSGRFWITATAVAAGLIFTAPGMEYHWRADQVTPEGTVEGETWRFRTLPKK